MHLRMPALIPEHPTVLNSVVSGEDERSVQPAPVCCAWPLGCKCSRVGLLVALAPSPVWNAENLK